MIEHFYVELGKRIRTRRRALNMTQEQLANVLGISRAGACNIECGRQRILPHALVRLMDALDVAPGFLSNFPPEPPSTNEQLAAIAARWTQAQAQAARKGPAR